jgi:polyisoprenyl-phosphate glycosyltransferase
VYDAAMTRDQLTIVVAAWNEAEALPLLHRRVVDAVEAAADERLDVRMLYVDDGSSDGTWEAMRALADADRRVALLRLSRNFGKEAALTAGLDRIEAGAALILDADGQDPPELIPQFVARAGSRRRPRMRSTG